MQDLSLPVDTPKPELCVVGIGASAGGLNALRTFFSRVPPKPGFACVVVVHLSPEHESHLVQMLQPYSRMPVRQVVKTIALEPNCVFVIPPNANLNSIDTHLRLSKLEGRRLRRAPIDHFLRTLAATHGESAIGIVLSGGGSDGALGIRQIKEHGGLTIAQDPREAEYASMPQSAIATGTVDLVLPLRDMAEEITSYCATQPVMAKRGADGDLAEDEIALLEKILGEVRLRTGQEFSMFRREMVLQRVRRRMRLRHVSTLESYLAVLQAQSEEPRALYQDLLLNVTEFFRDSSFFATVEAALREIVARKDEHDPHVRVWSIGCSTGEEAYSIAMLLIEQTATRSEEPFLQVFASELAPDVLQQAREGVYPQEIAASISQERLERFFVHENGRYRVRRELRDTVTFANHDLFKDPPYAHLDLIVCRNLLADLQPAMRRGVLSLFYYALEPHGMLIVERPEGLDTADLFTCDSAHSQLLRRQSGPRRALQLPAGLKPFERMSRERGGQLLAHERADPQALFRRAVEHHTPPSVLVDRDNTVVHFSETAARYVRLPGGALTHDILKLVPRTIARHLRGGLEAVRREGRPWQSDAFVTLVDDQIRHLTLRVERASPTEAPDLLLVVFEDARAPGAPDYTVGQQPMLDQVLKLQHQLDDVHTQLAVNPHTPGGAAESTQQQHSEAQSALIEELEGAREELQAVNEELLSVNQENHARVEILGELSNDLQHLLDATGFATLLLDQDLNIVRFTPLAGSLLQLSASDVGRPLAEIRHHLRHPQLIEELRPVVEHLATLEIEVESDTARWYLVRSQPYRTPRRGLEGATVLFIDITDRKRAELALREADRRKEEFLAVLAHELRNPLAPIVAGLELLRKFPNDRVSVQGIVATMARQTKQLVRLVDDLLEVVRINEDKLTLRVQPVSIAEVVRDAVSATQPLMESLEHELTLEVPEEPITVEGDAARLTQVVGNLLSNAVRYTPPRGKIVLRVRTDDEHVHISLQDSGRGLSSQALEHVFEMFYQARVSGVSETGLGIGLTLARKLVEMHGGAIRAESAGPNQGSTFTVTLPLASKELTARRSGAVAEGSEVARRHRVLIVDDNDDAAETLRLLVRTLGSGEVRTASNGPDALEIAASMRPEVVLLDLGMPGMDGYELARRMRAESWGAGALLVALTGWGQDQHRRRSQEAGFDRHMIKPADAEALRSVLNSC